MSNKSAQRLTRRGFSLIELVIVVVIIAIIGAIAIPKMSRGAAGAADSATIQNLSTLRSAIDLFNTEHPGNPLTSSSTATQVTDALLKYSDVNGNTNASKSTTYIYGPYLKSLPALPVGTNKGQTGVTTTGPAGTGAFGWYFDGTNFWANNPSTDVDARGTAYNTY